MSDEKVGQLFFLLELFQKVQNLCTDGNVQSGNRLVGYNQLRLHNHGTGQADTLTLSAGKLMRITSQMLGKKTNFLDDLLHLFHTVCLIFKQMEVIKSLGNDIVYGGTLV